MKKERININILLLVLIMAFCFLSTFCLTGCGGGDDGGGGGNEISYIPAYLTEQNLVNGAKAATGAAQVSGLSRSIYNDSMNSQFKLARSLLNKEPIDIESHRMLMKRYYSYDYKPEIYGSFLDNPQIHETNNSFSLSGDLWADYTPDDEIAGGKLKFNISIRVSLLNSNNIEMSILIKVNFNDFYYNGQHWLYEEGSKVNGNMAMSFKDTVTEDQIEGDMTDYLETCLFNLQGSITYTLEDGTTILVQKNETLGYDDLYNSIIRINGKDTVISNGLGILYELQDIVIGIYEDIPISGQMIARSGNETKTISFLNGSFQIDGQDIEIGFTPQGTFFNEPSETFEDTDNDYDNYNENEGDCDDTDPNINPGANEICGDGIDQDCDGSDLPCSYFPDIRGEYSGSYDVHVSNCIDPNDNGIYNFSVDINIYDQSNGTFSGSAIGTATFDGFPVTENIFLNGEITETGEIINGNTTHIFMETEGNGTFTGQLNGDTLTIENYGSDTVGDTCSYSRLISATR